MADVEENAGLARPLAYASPEPTDAYAELRLPADMPIYFPNLCCECLKQTDTRYTVRGNRVRFGGGVAGNLLRQAAGESDYFEMRVVVCNRCWRQYLRRRNWWMWFGPAVGAGIALALDAAILFDARHSLSADASAVLVAILFFFLGAAAGAFLNIPLLSRVGRPPAKVRLRLLTMEASIRFHNPEYAQHFLHAQLTGAEKAAERLQTLDTAAKSVAAPAEWFYAQNGESLGPVTYRDLRTLAAAGELLPGDMVYTDSQPDWLQAGKVPGLFQEGKTGGGAD